MKVQPFHRWRVPFVLAVLLAASQPTAAQPAYPVPSGIYCSCGPTTGRGHGSVDPSVASKPFVAGILVRTTWELLEPAEGAYNWALIDEQITAANYYGKKIALGIGCGVGIPHWVFDAGARMLVTSVPFVDTIAVPWDTIFLGKWTTMIEALGQRYRGDTTITLVYMTHSTANGFEMQLPFACTPSLADAGYSDALMIQSWSTVIDAFDHGFPNHYLTNDFHPVNGSDAVGEAVYAYARSTLGERYGASGWWWTEKNRTVYPAQYEILRNAAANSVFCGIQMAVSGTRDSARLANGGLQTALQIARDDGICYWEIWNEDILNPKFDSLLAHASCGGTTGLRTAEEAVEDFSLYPNPARSTVSVSSDARGTFEIRDMLGRIAGRFHLRNGQKGAVDISGLRPGIYIVRRIGGAHAAGGRRLLVLK